jgi:hypothetical protein
MNSEEELVLIFGALHLVAAALGGLLLLLFMRSEDTEPYREPPDENEGGGGGGNDRRPARPKPSPSPGGIPLPDAIQSRTRLRGAGRLADAHPRRGRRWTPEPQRTPRRTPARR